MHLKKIQNYLLFALLFIISCTSSDVISAINEDSAIVKSSSFEFRRASTEKTLVAKAKTRKKRKKKKKKRVSSDCSYDKKIDDPKFMENADGNDFENVELWQSEAAKSLKYLPKDKAGFYTDWVASAKLGLINPLGTLTVSEKEEKKYEKDTLMIVKSKIRNNVCFPHEIHTYWLGCDNCHPEIFVAKKNANPISMTKIIKGEFCGRCHGKVAFHVANNCHRCHNTPK